MTRPTLILDLDGTLIDTEQLYVDVLNEFLDILATQGIDRNEANVLLRKTDDEAIKTHGLIPERFIDSMVITYKALVNDNGFNKNLEAEVRRCGRKILDQSPNLLDGALELLEWASKKFRMILLTRGVEWLQMRKIKDHQMERFFEEVVVVPVKNDQVWQQVTNELKVDPATTWSVGDSARHDVKPSIKLGLNAIHLKYTGAYDWEYDHEELVSNRHLTAKSLWDVREILMGVGEMSLAD